MKLRNVRLKEKEELSNMLESKYYLTMDEKKLNRIFLNAKLQSIIIIMENLEENLCSSTDFVWLEQNKICSELDSVASEYWRTKDEYYTEKKEKMEKELKEKLGKKFNKDPSFYIDQIIKKIMQKYIYPKVKKEIIEKYKAEYKDWKLRIKGIERDRLKYYWHRRYDELPYPLNLYWDYRNDWIQMYIVEKNNKIFHISGYPASSWGRECHGFFGHKFAELNIKKPILSRIFVYTKNNELKFYKQFNNLVLISRDLIGNYKPKILIKDKNLLYCRFSTGFFNGKFWIKVGKKKY